MQWTLELCYVKCAGAHVGDPVFQTILSPTPTPTTCTRFHRPWNYVGSTVKKDSNKRPCARPMLLKQEIDSAKKARISYLFLSQARVPVMVAAVSNVSIVDLTV